MDVIQRMHAKGEELRCLKSPERSPSVPKSLRSPEHSRSPSLSDKRSPPGSSGSGSGQPSKLYEGIRINSSASSTRAARYKSNSEVVVGYPNPILEAPFHTLTLYFHDLLVRRHTFLS